MVLFGMMSWLYTWYKSRIDPDAEMMARQISDIFLQGVRGETASTLRPKQLGNAIAAATKPLPRKGVRRGAYTTVIPQ